MRIVYSLVGVVFLLSGLASCTAFATTGGTTPGSIMALIGFICLFAGDILHSLRRIAELLEQLRDRFPRA